MRILTRRTGRGVPMFVIVLLVIALFFAGLFPIVNAVRLSNRYKRFKAELSKPVGEYVNDTIMFEAGQLLLKTNLSILAISEKYGFSDQFYFSRRFKEKFGVSPMKYRKNIIP